MTDQGFNHEALKAVEFTNELLDEATAPIGSHTGDAKAR